LVEVYQGPLLLSTAASTKFKRIATDDTLAMLIAAVEAEINEGKTLPMFDEHGEFIEHS